MFNGFIPLKVSDNLIKRVILESQKNGSLNFSIPNIKPFASPGGIILKVFYLKWIKLISNFIEKPNLKVCS